MTADWEERSKAAWRLEGYLPITDWLCPRCRHQLLVRAEGTCTWRVVCDWCLRGTIETVVDEHIDDWWEIVTDKPLPWRRERQRERKRGQ